MTLAMWSVPTSELWLRGFCKARCFIFPHLSQLLSFLRLDLLTWLCIIQNTAWWTSSLMISSLVRPLLSLKKQVEGRCKRSPQSAQQQPDWSRLFSPSSWSVCLTLILWLLNSRAAKQTVQQRIVVVQRATEQLSANRMQARRCSYKYRWLTDVGKKNKTQVNLWKGTERCLWKNCSYSTYLECVKRLSSH